MNRISRRFLWGIKEDQKKYMALRSWDIICTPKQVGGVGIRRFKDANIAQVTKLGWKICNEQHNTWVKLIRLKYLRG